jgi:hypothetical protein
MSECSTPVDDIPIDMTAVEVASRFNYLACNEYRDTNKKLYYQLEFTSDGEYIHILPRVGDSFVSAVDYHDGIAAAVKTCVRIRAFAVQRAVPLAASRCTGLADPF